MAFGQLPIFVYTIMASVKQINQYVETPFGKLHIYTDPAELEKATKLIKGSSKILYDAYRDAASRWGGKVVKAAKKCIASQVPPKGVSWPPLSEKYKDWVGGDDRIYFKSGQYYEAIGVHEEKVEFYRSTKTGYRYFVGLPNGVKKWPARYSTKKPLTLQKVAKILEFGAKDIPPRPLWIPLYKEMGGDKRIQLYVKNAIKRQLKKYM